MVILYKKHHLFHKVHVRGHSGGTILNFVPSAGSLLGNVASSLISKLDFSNIAKTLGGLAVGSIASYGVNKFLNNASGEKSIGPIPDPQLTIGSIPQGILKDDVLPLRDNIEVVNPKNHVIHLSDGMVKNVNTIEKPPDTRRAYGAGLYKRKKSGGNLNKILSQKSKDILSGIVSDKKQGRGMYRM